MNLQSKCIKAKNKTKWVLAITISHLVPGQKELQLGHKPVKSVWKKLKL